MTEVNEGEPVGLCETHGLVTGDDVSLNFPNPATCELCGSVLEEARVAPRDMEVEGAN